MNFTQPYINSIEYYLPKNKLTNSELSSLYNWSEEKIFTKTGVQERYYVDEDEFVLDLAEKAAIKLFETQKISSQDIDFIILCTQSPDYLIPTTACILQSKLNLPKHCGAFDINLGCSGFIYSLALAKSLINTGIASNVLLIMAETYTKHIHPMDKSTRTIFGDGAAAILVKEGSPNANIGDFVFGTDGNGAFHLMVPAGGMRMPRSSDTSVVIKDKYGNQRSSNNLYMNGPEIYNFTVDVIPQLVNDILIKNEMVLDEIDFFVFHQASSYMLQNLRKKINVPEGKFYVNLNKTGNTVSASIPIALKMATEEGRIHRGDKIMMAGFGVGYSWGGTIIEY